MMALVMVVVMVMVTLIKMNDRCKRPLREKMETRRSLASRKRSGKSRLYEVIDDDDGDDGYDNNDDDDGN